MTQRTDTTVTVVSLPYFVTLALEVLPRFLEAICGTMRLQHGVKSVQYFPNPDDLDLANDPENGTVVFYTSEGEAISFHFRYRPGEEGTRGSLDRIEKIIVERQDHMYAFDFLEHKCLCRTCPGMKFPFCPEGTNRYVFEGESEEIRLHLIRRHMEER